MDSRPKASGPTESVAKTCAECMLNMISVCNFISPPEAAKLSSALSDSSPYNVSDTKHLMAAIDKHVWMWVLPKVEAFPQAANANCWNIGATI